MVAMMSCGIHEQGWRKGPWTPEEDKLLIKYVSKHGEGRWSSVARCAGMNRTGKSCRLRWVNYLRPGLKRGHLTPQEKGIIFELHALWGNKWSTIARYLPGRTDNEIKNYWRTHFKNKEKSSQKQEKRRQELKEKRDQQQLLLLQQEQQPRKYDMQQVQDIFDGTSTENVKPMIEKQDMLSAYPTMEDKCVPFMQYYQDVSPIWSDTAGYMDLWGGLWSLDETYGSSNYGITNKVTMQTHDRTFYGEGALATC